MSTPPLKTANTLPSGPSADAPMFLSAEEVGHELGISRSRVYELAAAGQLPVVRLGRRMWFPRRGLDALAEAAMREFAEAPHRAH